jgi:hypothetical protein
MKTCWTLSAVQNSGENSGTANGVTTNSSTELLCHESLARELRCFFTT